MSSIITVKLTRGKVAVISAEDLPLISQYKWCALKARKTYYAITAVRQESGKRQQKIILIHRLIMKASDGSFIDHIDGDGLNNKRENLRPCSISQNGFNRKKHSPGHSLYKGVSPCTGCKRSRWFAAITVAGKTLYLGSFGDEVAAALAYDAAARLHFGEFARPNFPDGEPMITALTARGSFTRAEITLPIN